MKYILVNIMCLQKKYITKSLALNNIDYWWTSNKSGQIIFLLVSCLHVKCEFTYN